MQKKLTAIALLITASLVLVGCAPASDEKSVVLVTHDSFAMSDELIATFEEESGYDLKLLRAGDAGEMTNKLILTKNQPIGDAVFGIDNALKGIAEEKGLLGSKLEAISFGDVCLNLDIDWFASRGKAEPTTLQDLVLPEFKKLTVLSNPATSSPGMAFLSTTIAVFGEEGYLGYWEQLKANQVKIVSGWEDAYFTEFSGSSGKGKYPVVLSYSSSPAFEIRDDGKSQTKSIRTDCYRQTEFAGVLANAKNSAGAKALVEFLRGKDFQAALPDAMYVYPIDQSVELPKAWETFAPAALTLVGEELDVAGNRESWLKAWSRVFE